MAEGEEERERDGRRREERAAIGGMEGEEDEREREGEVIEVREGEKEGRLGGREVAPPSSLLILPCSLLLSLFLSHSLTLRLRLCLRLRPIYPRPHLPPLSQFSPPPPRQFPRTLPFSFSIAQAQTATQSTVKRKMDTPSTSERFVIGVDFGITYPPPPPFRPGSNVAVQLHVGGFRLFGKARGGVASA